MFKKQILASLILAGAAVFSSSAEAAETDPKPADEPNLPRWRDPKLWSYQVGVGFIGASTIDEILIGDSRLAEGDAGGQIYLLQASHKLKEFEPEWFGHRVKFDLELPLVLGIVNERGRDSAFMQYSGGVTVRWKTFPWNKWVYTNLETGVGLTYSQYVLATERVRHPDRERSHLEFYWPIQLMLAHPDYREHQLVLFLHHHSGGGIFHTGGANTLGVGYRYVFGER
jgi:hypothetical protein